MTSDDPTALDRGYILRAAGLRRSTVRWTSAAAFLGLLSTAGAGAWAIWVTHEAASRFEVRVVYLDQSNRPAFTSALGEAFVPEDGVYLAMARDWILNMRARPLEEQTLRLRRAELRAHTDQRLYARVGGLLAESDQTVARGIAIDVSKISATPLQRRKAGMVLSVRWTEQTRQAGSRPVDRVAMLTVATKPNPTRDEFDGNPLGLYAIDFTITQEQS